MLTRQLLLGTLATLTLLVAGCTEAEDLADPAPQAGEGDACSFHGKQCESGLACEYHCPFNAEPPCNLGINPSGMCVPTGPPKAKTGERCYFHGIQCEESLYCDYLCIYEVDGMCQNYGVNPNGTCKPLVPGVQH